MCTTFGVGSPAETAQQVESHSRGAAQNEHTSVPARVVSFYPQQMTVWDVFTITEASKAKLALCIFLEMSWQTVLNFSHASGDRGHPSNRPYCYSSLGFFGLCIYFSRLLIAFCSFQLFVLERQIISKPVQASISLSYCPTGGGWESRERAPGGHQRRGWCSPPQCASRSCYVGHQESQGVLGLFFKTL